MTAGVNLLKVVFIIRSAMGRNKLERLYLESQIFAGKARSYPSGALEWQSLYLTFKYYTRLERLVKEQTLQLIFPTFQILDICIQSTDKEI